MKNLKLLFGMMAFMCLSLSTYAQDPDITSTTDDGRVGINNNTPRAVLDLSPNTGNGGLLFTTNGNHYSSIGNNAYYNGGWKRIGVGGKAAGQGNLVQFTPWGSVYFQAFGAGAADSDITLKNIMRLFPGGHVLIGEGNLHKTSSNANISANDYKLFVENGILTEKVKVATVGTNDWADFVFEEDYDLNSIEEVEAFVEENNHLPNVPSAQEVEENGVEMVEMDATLLRQVEELWLHTIELNKAKKDLEQENADLQDSNETLKESNETLTQQFELLLQRVEALEAGN